MITYLSIGMKAGLVLASPWIIYQLWLFIAAGLFERERKVVYKYHGPELIFVSIGGGVLLFSGAAAHAQFFHWIHGQHGRWNAHGELAGANDWGLNAGSRHDAMPTTIAAADTGKSSADTDGFIRSPKPPDGSVYLYYNATDGLFKYRIGDDILVFQAYRGGSLFNNIPQLDQYMTFLTWTGLIFGLAFELPMVILVLAKIGIVKVKTFRSVRKYAYFVIAVISCIAAPSTDVLTMLCLMVPLIGLYEAGVIAAAISTRKAPPDESVTD